MFPRARLCQERFSTSSPFQALPAAPGLLLYDSDAENERPFLSIPRRLRFALGSLSNG